MVNFFFRAVFFVGAKGSVSPFCNEIKIIEGIDYRIHLKVNNIEKSSVSMKLPCIFDNFSTNLGYLEQRKSKSTWNKWK